jgi:hypothetical protein
VGGLHLRYPAASAVAQSTLRRPGLVRRYRDSPGKTGRLDSVTGPPREENDAGPNTFLACPNDLRYAAGPRKGRFETRPSNWPASAILGELHNHAMGWALRSDYKLAVQGLCANIAVFGG